MNRARVIRTACPYGSIDINGVHVDFSGLEVIGVSLLFRGKANFNLAIDANDCKAKLESLWVERQDATVKYMAIYGCQKLLWL